MAKTTIPDVLAHRYASEEMVAIWGLEQKTIMERELWVAVMKLQKRLGVEIPDGAIEAYEAALYDVDLIAIETLERKLRHDVKAKIEVFNALAGHEQIHKGMTSRDLTENVEQMQVRRSLELIRNKAVTVLVRMAELATENSSLVMAGRSHNVAAQPITLGKRFANFGEELLHAFGHLDYVLGSYPLRGIKGPVGTQQDMLDILPNPDDIVVLERGVAEHLGFESAMGSVGQVYPRSLDSEVVSCLLQLAGGPSSLATTIRLMAGQELVTEGFQKDQVGSTAMPHKMNTRSCERINALTKVLKGLVVMANELLGDQWNEGDVSCSVVRRVVLPDAFFAIDGIFETLLTVLEEFGAFPKIIAAELRRFLPFLATTKLLMAAVRMGVGRETAHEMIKEKAVSAALSMREGEENLLLIRLDANPDWPVSLPDMKHAISSPIDLVGAAVPQIQAFARSVEGVVAKYPEAATYRPGSIL
ncbi:adenylosuccinate lyase [Candidatus Saccharibacteria bacterium]|nr:adenylosuccinate lyase [Candidatus Saccharibacteria bacterium]